MPTWRERVSTALNDIGGEGALSEIYEAVRARRSSDLPPTWQAIVRRELEYNSSDSQSYKGRYDLFKSVDGIGSGIWALRAAQESKTSLDHWSDEEVRALVSDYFNMLKLEIQEQEYNKAAHRLALMKLVSRSEGAIEFKHQNVSAILDRLGYRWIEGYKPRSNVQKALVDEVARHLSADTVLIDQPLELNQLSETAYADVFVAPPKLYEPAETKADFAPIAKQHDIAMRDARNRELGRVGEEFVFNLEQARLIASGRPDLAKLVVWVSRDLGDGLGYDVESYDAAGEKKLIEVKTTKGPIESPFFLSSNEIFASKRYGANSCLYRVFQFGKQPKIYVIPSPLDVALHLEPVSYRATVASGAEQAT